MTRTQIYLPEEMLLQIKLIAKMKKIKMAELFREFLAKSLENEAKNQTNKGKKTLGDMIGMFSTNSPTNSATDHNSIYDI